MDRDPYEVLQVSPNAEPEVIEAAYRRLARKYHPDMDRDQGATLRMQEINWAHEILQNPAKRAAYDLRRKAWKTSEPTYPRPQSRPQETGPAAGNRETDATARRPSTTPPKPEPTVPITDPSYLTSVLVGALLLGAYYLASLVADFTTILPSTTPAYVVVVISIGGSAILAITAAAGWNPKRIHIGRVLLMWALAAFPISSWIPCYYAGKAIARKIAARKPTVKAQSKPRTFLSRWPLIAFGILGVLLNVLVFGDIFDQGVSTRSAIEFQKYSDPELGVAFDHPSFLAPQASTTRERTDAGTIFSVSTITGESTNPTLALGLRIIEDPLRNRMFPELYPPSEDALRILLIGDLADLQFSESEVPQQDLLSAPQEAIVLELSGFPAAAYSIRATDTAIGDALLRGALVVTNRRDVSLFMLGSVEPNVEGSFTSEQIEAIWERFSESLRLDY